MLALKDPHHWTHGEEGLGADYTRLPHAFVGIVNTKNLYWLALAFAAVVFFVVRWATESSPGRVWQAIRENEMRVEVLGLRPHAYKLQAFVLSSVLAAAGGIVYMLLYNGSTLGVTEPTFTLTLLLMVVIGGAGSRWGAVLGGILYTYLDDRLVAIGSSSAVHGLPQRATDAARAATLPARYRVHPHRRLSARRDRRPRGSRSADGPPPSGGSCAHHANRHRAPGGSMSVSYAQNGDVRLAYEVHGSGEPVVLVHGLGYDRFGWGPLPGLLAQDFTVVTFDNRGVGDSDVPDGPYAVAQMAADTVAVLDAAGIDTTHVFGVSLGGYIAEELALTYPERVRTLVLASTAPGGPRSHPMPAAGLEAFGRFPTMEREAGLRLMVENSLGAHGVRERPDLVEEIYRYRLERGPTIAGWQNQAYAGATFDATTAVARSPRRRSSPGRSRQRRRPAQRASCSPS